MRTREIILIAYNVRSCHNIGSLMRTSEGLAVKHMYLAGYSPYPEAPEDKRLPHIRKKLSRQIHKTALGAEETLKWSHEPDITKLIMRLKVDGYEIAALEQTRKSTELAKYSPGPKVALVAGNEVSGLDQSVLDISDSCLEIPMLGAKESLNVAVAAAIALYHLRSAKT